MFATLDPTVRHIVLPSHRKVLFSDTVGFIRNLPTTLVKAFRATLEEVTEASLLLHVVDVSSAYAPQQTAHVHKVLAEIGADDTPQILVMNKVDLLPQGILGETRSPESSAEIAVSGRSGAGFESLLALIDKMLVLDPVSHAVFRLPAGEGSLLHLLHERARVLSTSYSEEECEVEAEVPLSVRKKLEPFLIAS
jgi:GTP-binding protein HflX